MGNHKKSAEDLVHDLASRIDEMAHQHEEDQAEIKRLRVQLSKRSCTKEHVTPAMRRDLAALAGLRNMLPSQRKR